MVVHHQDFADQFDFVVATADADGVDVAPVHLGLGTHMGVAADLGGGGLQDTGFKPFRQSQHVDAAHDAGFDRLDQVILVMHGGGGTGQVVDPIDLKQDRLGYIMPDKLEAMAAHQMYDVVFAACEEVVKAKDVMPPFGQEAFAEVRAYESRSASYQYAHIFSPRRRFRRCNSRAEYS